MYKPILGQQVSNKEELIYQIKDVRDNILPELKKEGLHSKDYYDTAERLINEALEKLDKINIPENIRFSKHNGKEVSGWFYKWSIGYEGFEVLLCREELYKDENDDSILDQYFNIPEDKPEFRAELFSLFSGTWVETDRYSLFYIPAKYLTVEEFADIYNVPPATVRQWIRRGKIRTAKKISTGWVIPELTDPPKTDYKKYQMADYDISELSSLESKIPEEYSYLNDGEEITITVAEDDKKAFIITVLGERDAYGIRKPLKKLVMTSSEKEKLELFLIANEKVKYIPINYEALMGEITLFLFRKTKEK